MLQRWIRQPRFRADRSASHCASRPCTGDNFRMRTLILAGRGFRTQRQAYDGPVRRTNSIDTICTHTTAAAYVLGAASRTPECDICFTSCIRILKSFVLNVEIHNDEFGVLDFNLWVWHSMWHATWNICETNEKLPCSFSSWNLSPSVQVPLSLICTDSCLVCFTFCLHVTIFHAWLEAPGGQDPCLTHPGMMMSADTWEC